MSNKNETKKITSIGGSALIEGIMMRGPKKTTVALRTGENDIYTEDVEMKMIGSKGKFFRIPFIRGFVGLIDSMRLSYKCLMLSADKAVESGEVEEEEPSKFEKWIDKTFGDKFMKILMVISSVLGVALAVVLFFFLPTWIFQLLGMWIPALAVEVGGTVPFWQSLTESILRILIFVGYIFICSQMSEMKRVFQYHGAEHKTIFCYENELELTTDNVMKMRRFHPRCGTSFILLMLIVGFIIGLFIPAFPAPITWLRPVIKILLLPLTCGIGYELIKLCGKYDNTVTRIIAAPGLWAQRITTKEPDEKMCQ
ncbi:MAG: DUF1385 domain-containing protein, partial [Ruminococcus sp.]